MKLNYLKWDLSYVFRLTYVFPKGNISIQMYCLHLNISEASVKYSTAVLPATAVRKEGGGKQGMRVGDWGYVDCAN